MLAIEKRSRELRPYSGALSPWRYMPRPAGLIDIDERSAPSEVKAPAMAMARAVPKLNCVCESSIISVGISRSLSIRSPPHC